MWPKETYTGKLALIFHAAEYRGEAGNVAVSVKTLDNAYKLAKYFVNQALDIDMDQRIGINERKAFELIEAIGEKGGQFKVRELMRTFRSDYPRKLDLQPMVEYLVDGELVYVTKTTPEGGGTPSEWLNLTDHGKAFLQSEEFRYWTTGRPILRSSLANEKPR